MPLPIAAMLPTIVVRREAFERQELLRTEIDARFNLTDAEFRVEGGLIAIGPLPSDEMVGPMLEYFEEKGLAYFDDVFELSGNWPEWLKLFALTT
jgi:hypothetical protein